MLNFIVLSKYLEKLSLNYCVKHAENGIEAV